MKDSKALRLFFIISTLLVIFLTSVAVYQIIYQNKAMDKCMADIGNISEALGNLYVNELE